MSTWRIVGYYLALLVMIVPWRAQAADADDFVAANRTQQARLLEQWAAAPDARRLPLLRALKAETLVAMTVATPSASSRRWEPRALRKGRQNRFASPTACVTWSPGRWPPICLSVTVSRKERQPSKRYSGRRRRKWRGCCNNGWRLKPMRAKTQLDIALARLQLASPDSARRLAAVEQLGHSVDPDTQALLIPYTDLQHEPDARVRAAAANSLSQIKQRLLLGDILGQAFMGLSLGSVLLLAALGLAITYGLLGVINMAHGEMLMIGAYSCWLVQQALAQLAPQWLAFYPLVALPVAFLITGGIGMALERTIIRHLYGRPLETLLATWGISLMLIQLVRMLFGAQNLEVANPAWLSGGCRFAEPDPAVEPPGGAGLCAAGAVLHLVNSQ
jgi:urea transport system permease protein